MNPLTYVVVIGFALVLLLQWRTLRYAAGLRKVEPGDIVFYSNPDSKDSRQNNILSIVLDVPAFGVATIRSKGTILSGSTTCVVLQKHLQVLKPSPGDPIYVPGEAKRDFHSDLNAGTWIEIKQEWFPYTLPRYAKRSA